jgi:hypothetical protein
VVGFIYDGYRDIPSYSKTFFISYSLDSSGIYFGCLVWVRNNAVEKEYLRENLGAAFDLSHIDYDFDFCDS